MAGIATVNPANGETLERFEHHTSSDVERRLDAALACWEQWRTTSFEKRATLLANVAQRLHRSKGELARTATLEIGKPIAEAEAEVAKCARACEYFAHNAAMFLRTERVDGDPPGEVAFRPLGAILAVMPWNFPYWQVFRFAAPALMAGNVALLKHASNVTRCALHIEALFREAGASDGMFTTLLLPSERIADLIADPRIAAVTLTGSEAAGIAVATASGKALKKTVLELGGSDPFIVLADADLEAAIDAAVRSRYQNTGQSCIAAKRFIVEEPVAERFARDFKRRVRQLRVGDPLDRATQIGPLARVDLRDALHQQVTGTLAAGAELLCGGEPLHRQGFYYAPTIVAKVTPQMPMFREETFGPAATITTANDARSAIELANDSDFGLGATIFSANVDRARDLAGEIQSGSVAINTVMASDPRLPFGGVKRSGYGRELGAFGIREFVNIQTITTGEAAAAAVE